MSVILVDQDGVLADFERGFLENYRAKYPDELFVPLKDRKSFYIKEDYPKNLKSKIEEIHFAKGFYLNLPPIEGAIRGFKELCESGFDVFICTAPLSRYENCVLEKYEWVEKHLGRDATKRIIITGDKTLVRGKYLIDDRPEVSGVCNPKWEHVLYDAPYNRHIDYKRRMTWKDWGKIVAVDNT